MTKDPSGGEKVVVLGGVDRYACGQPMCECEAELMEDVEGFNPVTAKWEILPNLPIALAGAVAIAPGGGRGEIHRRRGGLPPRRDGVAGRLHHRMKRASAEWGEGQGGKRGSLRTCRGRECSQPMQPSAGQHQ